MLNAPVPFAVSALLPNPLLPPLPLVVKLPALIPKNVLFVPKSCIKREPFLIILPNVLLVESTIEISQPTERLQVIFATPIRASVDDKLATVPFVMIASVEDKLVIVELVIISSVAESIPVIVASAAERYVTNSSVEEKLVIVPFVIIASAAESMPVTVASAAER